MTPEQEQRAQHWMFLGDRIEHRTKGPWDNPDDYIRADDHAAALEQARREGDAAGYRRGVKELRDNLLSDDDDAVVRGWILGSSARLLSESKEERGEC